MEGVLKLALSLFDEVYPLAALDDLLLDLLDLPPQDVGPEDLFFSQLD